MLIYSEEHIWNTERLTSPSPSPKSNPQIQSGKGEFGLWAVSKNLWATTTTARGKIWGTRLPRMEVKRDKSSQMRFQLIWCPLYS